MRQRILIVAPGHPEIRFADAEAFAYDQFLQQRESGDVDVWFLGTAPRGYSHLGSPFSLYRGDDELLWHAQPGDEFRFCYGSKDPVTGSFPEVMALIKPDIVHFHHYRNVGVELLEQVKRVNPASRVVLSLHDHAALCHHAGVMLKTRTLEPCLRSSPYDCHRCFPDKSPADFFLRAQYLKVFFNSVDIFVTHSQVLRQRYADWGLDPERIEVMPGCWVAPPDGTERAASLDDEPLRVGYFLSSEIDDGVELLARALRSLPLEVSNLLRLEVYGTPGDGTAAAPTAALELLRSADYNSVNWLGYLPFAQLRETLADLDVLVFPQEARAGGRYLLHLALALGFPVIAPAERGLEELMAGEYQVMFFKQRDSVDLARVMARSVNRDSLRTDAGRPSRGESLAQRLGRLYAQAERREPLQVHGG